MRGLRPLTAALNSSEAAQFGTIRREAPQHTCMKNLRFGRFFFANFSPKLEFFFGFSIDSRCSAHKILGRELRWKPSMLDEAIGVAVLTMQETFE